MSNINPIRKVLPSVFTLGNLAFGFLSILAADYFYSPLFLFAGLLCDALDGALARKLGVQSDMGRELDSLADMVSFGLAPAYLYHMMAPKDNLIEYIAPLIIIIGSALRLAKFNLMPAAKYFTGLPTPANAMFYIGIFLAIHFDNKIIVQLYENQYVYLFTAIFMTLLCISGLKMFSLKGLERNVLKNRYQLLMLFIFVSLLFINIQLAIPLGIIFYIVLSIFYTMTLKFNT